MTSMQVILENCNILDASELTGDDIISGSEFSPWDCFVEFQKTGEFCRIQIMKKKLPVYSLS